MGAPLRHFASPSSLLAALSAQGFEQLVAAVDDAVEAGQRQDARSRLARAGVGYVRFALDEPGVFSVMFRRELVDTADPAYLTAGSASFDQLVGLVAAAQAEGWQRGVPSERIAAVMWAKVHGLAELWLHGSLQGVVDAGIDELVALAVGLDVSR